MKFKKKALVLGFLVFLGLLWAIPATRDELEWCWTESADTASAYMRYASDWPQGGHIAEAKLRYDQRNWGNTKRAMIAEALKKSAAAESDPEARAERKLRLQRFFWKQVTDENTTFGYEDYLQRYPNGEYAAQARQKIRQLKNQQGSVTQ